MRKNNNITSEYSIKEIIPDYINFVLVLILGLSFHQKGINITHSFLIQIGMLVICSILTLIYYLFKAHITSKKKTSSYSFLDYYVYTIFFIVLSVFLCVLLFSNFPINLVCFPSVLYACRKRFQKLKQNPLEILYLFFYLFMIASCVPLLFIPEIFKDTGLPDTISFFICYSVLCFPYKGTYDLLFSTKTKKKIHAFFSNPINLFGIAVTLFSLVFILVMCCDYWESNDGNILPHIGIFSLFAAIGIIICL